MGVVVVVVFGKRHWMRFSEPDAGLEKLKVNDGKRDDEVIKFRSLMLLNAQRILTSQTSTKLDFKLAKPLLSCLFIVFFFIFFMLLSHL